MQRGLKNRHLQMIALGTAVGTGLFYGSRRIVKLFNGRDNYFSNRQNARRNVG